MFIHIYICVYILIWMLLLFCLFRERHINRSFSQCGVCRHCGATWLRLLLHGILQVKKTTFFPFSQTHKAVTQINKNLEEKFAVVVNQPQCWALWLRGELHLNLNTVSYNQQQEAWCFRLIIHNSIRKGWMPDSSAEFCWSGFMGLVEVLGDFHCKILWLCLFNRFIPSFFSVCFFCTSCTWQYGQYKKVQTRWNTISSKAQRAPALDGW